MYSYTSTLALVAFITSVHAHGILTNAQGPSGPASQGFLVDPTLARNCTTISPCQQDSTIIRNSEITQNIVNSCGRTEIAGNIDVGEQTENELAANRVTQVTQGSTMTVTIHQVNADGAGPYECDLDETSNGATNFVPLTVTNNVPGSNGLSQNKEADFNITVQMPENFNCIGASTGDICTVRCRNNAVAGPFGGCVAVQQTDGTGRTNTTAAAVDTAQTLSGILAQVEQNKKDLPAAIAANQVAAPDTQGAAAISALVPSSAAATTAAAAASATAKASTGKNNGNGNGNGNASTGNNNNNNGNANAAAGNTNNNNGNAAGNTATGNTAAGNTNTNANGATNTNNGNGNGRGNGRGNANNNRRRKFLRDGLN
ncbi:hypothetical protein P154DRAFT_556009 [Amniculicola lignicola CBS 123094]|uniref:GEgh 16 protein n=1 Tax=Amniculicola lignicola CBS 123094 TaxID=1392246 RepID=A0A6A5W568_9PLEO|nr:hypothetical protein P154DRAFT_556009 [Amniculicola lignicola CBS 123094]